MKTDRTIRIAKEGDCPHWDECINHPLQSWAWGEFRKRMGIDVVRLGEFEKDTLIRGFQISFHRIPYTPWTVGYFPKGPLPTAPMIQALRNIGKEKRAIYIQLEPNAINQNFPPGSVQLQPSHHPMFTKFTFVLDLTKSEEELLSAMHPKTRYNIKIAQKHNVIVKEDNSPRAVNEYLRLSEETTRRQGFFAHNRMYQQTMWNTMHAANIASLWTATYENKTLASWILFLLKDTVYYPYGASGREYRETMAPNLMMWEIARWAKRKGLKKFDLWGALGPTPDPHDPWYGFHRFKAGYNPNLIEFAGSYDLVLSPALYRIFCLADSVRWWFLRVLRG